MIKGRLVTLRVAEKEDAPMLAEWFNDPEFNGEFQHFPVQVPRAQLERRIHEHSLYGAEWVDFIAANTKGDNVAWIAHYTATPNFGWPEIGIAVSPEHRNKGYGSEAVGLITDYLFLSRDTNRVQSVADSDNLASVRIFEKAGFAREGVLRGALWNREGKWADGVMLSQVRSGWGQPRTIKR